MSTSKPLNLNPLYYFVLVCGFFLVISLQYQAALTDNQQFQDEVLNGGVSVVQNP